MVIKYHCQPPSGNIVAMTNLLDLPSGLRERILRIVLLGEQANSQVLRVCHQIHDEAEPMLYQRPQIFNSQEELFRWLALADWEHLHNVNTLKLQLQDLDTATVSQDFMLSSGSTTPDEYEEDLEQLDKALLQLPGVKHLCLYKTPKVNSRERYNYLYGQALRNVARWWPQLKSISFHGCEHPLPFVKATQEIEKLTFTGFSTSTPMETEAVFSRLRHLREIEIILPQRTFPEDALDGTRKCTLSLSLTREVVKSLRGLRTFTIRDTLDRPDSGPVFFTSEFLQAMDSSHRVSLRTLRIWLAFCPDDDAKRALYSLLSSSSIKHLTVFWPGFDGQLLVHLPNTLLTLQVPLPEDQPLEHLLGDVLRMKGELPSMRKLVVFHPSKPSRNNSPRQVRSIIDLNQLLL